MLEVVEVEVEETDSMDIDQDESEIFGTRAVKVDSFDELVRFAASEKYVPCFLWLT